jgi:hypothetical protein
MPLALFPTLSYVHEEEKFSLAALSQRIPFLTEN